MSSTYKNSLGELQETVWITYHDGVDGVPIIQFYIHTISEEDPNSAALGIFWNNGRGLLDR